MGIISDLYQLIYEACDDFMSIPIYIGNYYFTFKGVLIFILCMFILSYLTILFVHNGGGE